MIHLELEGRVRFLTSLHLSSCPIYCSLKFSNFGTLKFICCFLLALLCRCLCGGKLTVKTAGRLQQTARCIFAMTRGRQSMLVHYWWAQRLPAVINCPGVLLRLPSHCSLSHLFCVHMEPAPTQQQALLKVSPEGSILCVPKNPFPHCCWSVCSPRW